MSEQEENKVSQTGSEACNRQPFLSEDGCDRGNVDTHQFDDLPFCGDIYPTQPEIPPEVLETPWILPVPPHCSCIHINYNYKFNGFKEKFVTKHSFKSNGDCCEGDYDNDFEFELPCPIDKIKEKTFSAKLVWLDEDDEEGTSFEKVYVKDKKDDCGFYPEDIEFQVGLPCPIPPKVELQANFSWWDYSGDEGEKLDGYDIGPVNVFTKKEDDCGIAEQETPDLRFDIPCPIPKARDLRISMGWSAGRPFYNTTQRIIKRKKDNECSIDTSELAFDIHIPCPISDAEVSPGAGLWYWTQIGYTAFPFCGVTLSSDKSQYLIEACGGSSTYGTIVCHAGGACEKIWPQSRGPNEGWSLNGEYVDDEAVIHHLCCSGYLDCSCGDCGGGGNAKNINVCFNWKGSSSSAACASDTIAVLDRDNCTISVGTPKLNLNVPCPLDNIEFKFDNTIKEPRLVAKGDCDGFELRLPYNELQVVTGGYFNPSDKTIYFHTNKITGFFTLGSVPVENTEIPLPWARHICRV